MSFPRSARARPLKKVYADTNEYCEEASLDTQRLINLIPKSKFKITRAVEEADIIVFYACGHLERHEKDSVNILRKINSLKKPTSQLVVWGCLPKINPKALEGIYEGPLLGPESFGFFCKMFDQPEEMIKEITANRFNVHTTLKGTQKHSMRRSINFVRQRFYGINSGVWQIKIESGCRNCCTYCSDRLAYRWLKSQTCESILRQFELGLQQGFKYFSFVGRDLGSYGHDLGSSLDTLLNRILERFSNNEYRIILTNISPNTLLEIYPSIDQRLLSSKIFEIGSHVQTGSERILKLMGKRFPLDKWIEVIRDIDRRYPQIRTRTSIMVGFPGETKTDFQASVNLLNKILFDRIDVYKYQERPGLPSLQLADRVPEAEKEKRYNKMRYFAMLNNVKKRLKRFQLFY